MKARRKPSTKVDYTLRVDLTYEGIGKKPDAHELRRWLLDNIFAGKSPPHAFPKGKNIISLQVKCAGTVTTPSNPTPSPAELN